MNAEFAHLETSSQDKELESITSVPARYARFGEFCLDLVKQELSKGGARVKMQGKVCGVLMILLETPGEVVTREALCARLWPPDSRVNYDANVNTTVNKLRLVLGDSSDQSVYVETIPRKGYTFIAPVEYSDDAPATQQARKSLLRISSGPDSTNGHGEGSHGEVRQDGAPTDSPMSSVWFTFGVVALVVASILLGAAILLYTHRAF
jgi:DNA-binding winged helix-turn-helix (wHTH) protein